MKVDDRYMLSQKMKKYINSYDGKYQVRKGNLVINRTIAVSKTTREGVSRADTSDFICRELEENTNIDGMNLEGFNIRKLTEKEFFRLMGFCPIDEYGNFDDTNYYKASAVVSSTQLYKQMGNSIVVDCLASIFKELM